MHGDERLSNLRDNHVSQHFLLHFLEMCLYNDACNHALINHFCYIHRVVFVQ